MPLFYQNTREFSSSILDIANIVTLPLREKCPNTEFLWSVFTPNTGKYGPEETPYLDTFYAVSKL